MSESAAQLERNALYQARRFNHFGKKFEVWIKSGYYRVLQGQAEAKATMENYESLKDESYYGFGDGRILIPPEVEK